MDVANLRLKLLLDLAKDKIVGLLHLESWEELSEHAVKSHIDLADHVYSVLAKHHICAVPLDTLRIICSFDRVAPDEEHICQLYDFVYEH